MKPHNLSWWKKSVWKEVSIFVRLSNADYRGYVTCYTCGITKPWKEMQAGHGISGRGNPILYELDIIRPQCYGCNICGSGKLDVFTNLLKEELTTKRYNYIWKNRHKEKVKFTIPYLQELRYNFKKSNKLLLEIKGF